jgi:hypothetical protein
MKTSINRDPSSRALQAVCDRCGKHGLVYRFTAANRETIKGLYEFRICPPCFEAFRNFLTNGRHKEAQRAASLARNDERRKAAAALDQAGPDERGPGS